MFIVTLCQIGLQPFRQLAAREHYPPSATFAFESNIRAETCDDPFIGATGMLFTQAQQIVKLKIREHVVAME